MQRNDFLMDGKYSWIEKDLDFFLFRLLLSINKLNRELLSLISYFLYLDGSVVYIE